MNNNNMKKLNFILFAFIFLMFTMCAASQTKFLELEKVINISEKSKQSSQNISYDLSDCHLLEQYDSLHVDNKEIILTKKYKNIEALVTNPDKNLVGYLIDTFGIEPNIHFPVLKYKNRVLVNIFSTDFSYSFIVELKDSQKVAIALLYCIDDSPANLEVIEDE